MNILIIADPIIPVPPSHYGGAERIVALYAEELSRRGHRVHLMAGPGSRSYGGRLHIHKDPTLAYASRAHRKLRFQLQSLLAAHGCDWIFNHGRSDYLEALLRTRMPLVHMQHNPLEPREIAYLESRARGPFMLYGVSHDQLSRVPTRLSSLVIHNFVDTRQLTFSPQSSGYLAFLGRLTENKGVHTAIAVAQHLGRPLRIAGTISDEPGGREYFETRIRPQIDGERIVYVGPVNDAQKQTLLGGADALLFPTQWREPCAVVVSESLACGTPVVAFRIASNEELIEPGLTGELCSNVGDVEEMAAATERAIGLSRQACRATAERRFDVTGATDTLLKAVQPLLRCP